MRDGPKFPPHARGWTAVLACIVHQPNVSPARAGMDRPSRPGHAHRSDCGAEGELGPRGGADLKNFFGSLDHDWLLRFVEHRVGDPRLLSLIRRWLKAGVLEDGVETPSEEGTPQGGSISVLLSNVYLHYVLDLWFERVVRPVWVKLYHDRVAVAVGTEVVARHVRAFRAGATVLDPFHVLPVLERKHRAVPEATALQDWPLAPVWQQVRTALRQQTRKPDQEWVRMLRLLETYPAPAVEAAVAAALARDSPRIETVRLLLRQRAAGPRPAIRPVPTVRADLARIAVPAPTLAAYDVLTGGRV